jgi:hypothetical protein
MITYGQIVTGTAAAAVLQGTGVAPEDITGQGLTVYFNGEVYWILQREVYFPPSESSPDGWHLVYKPSEDEINLGVQDPGVFDNILSAIDSLGTAISRGAGALSIASPILIFGLAGIALFAAYSWSKRHAG